jgi:flagellar biosynthesis protein FliR
METTTPYNWLLKDLWPYALVFARWFTTSMLMPGMGALVISTQVRIPLILCVSVCLTPALQAYGLLETPSVSVVILLQEVLVGVFLGLFTRTLLQMLEISGALISHQAALSNAFMNQAVADEQSSLLGTFLFMCILALVFVNDFHHAVFRGLMESYRYFPAGGDLFLADMSQTMLNLVQQGFKISIQIASPFLILGTVFYVTMGLLNRLMPQIHIFFISQPLDIFLNLLIFVLALSNICIIYMEFLFNSYGQLSGR